MNWLSAFDVIPLAIIVLCAIGELSRVAAHRQPFRAFLLVLIAVGAFHTFAVEIHGATTAWWELLLDVVMAVIFVLSLAAGGDVRQENQRTAHRTRSQTQG
jgi:hypothetical protein